MLDSVFENDDAQDNGIDWDVLGFWAQFFFIFEKRNLWSRKIEFFDFQIHNSDNSCVLIDRVNI